MRSIPLLAATSVILMVATGCGDDGPTDIDPPVANFSQTCTELTCTFADQSDPAGGAITEWEWDFGDPTSGASNTSDDQNPVHIFTAANTYQVRLTVTDADGETNSITKPVTVTGGTGGGLAPIASFTPSCTELACTFDGSTSTDDGDIVTYAWTFGEGTAAGTGEVAAYTYTAPGTYTVTLTVTDNEGLTGVASQQVTVAPAQGQSCTQTSATDVTCTITLTQRSIVSIRLESEDCEIGNNNVLIPPPGERAQTVFFNVCNLQAPQDRTLTNDSGTNMIFEAGTQLPIVFRRGPDPVAGPPQARFLNTTTNSWSISIDDGGNPGGPGEPDFADVILTVTATPQ